MRVWRFIQPLLCENLHRVLAKTDKLVSPEQPRCWRRNHRIRLVRNFSDLSKWNSAPRNDRGTEVVIRGGQISFYFRSVSSLCHVSQSDTWIEWGDEIKTTCYDGNRDLSVTRDWGKIFWFPAIPEVETIQTVANEMNREDFPLSPVHLRCEHQNSKSRYILDNSAFESLSRNERKWEQICPPLVVIFLLFEQGVEWERIFIKNMRKSHARAT